MVCEGRPSARRCLACIGGMAASLHGERFSSGMTCGMDGRSSARQRCPVALLNQCSRVTSLAPCWLVHPPQPCAPVGHVHTPLVQVLELGHRLLHAPQ